MVFRPADLYIITSTFFNIFYVFFFKIQKNVTCVVIDRLFLEREDYKAHFTTAARKNHVNSHIGLFLQCVSIACYAESCINCSWVSTHLSVHPSVCHTLALCQENTR